MEGKPLSPDCGLAERNQPRMGATDGIRLNKARDADPGAELCSLDLGPPHYGDLFISLLATGTRIAIDIHQADFKEDRLK
jgi:hypothetical protein